MMTCGPYVCIFIIDIDETMEERHQNTVGNERVEYQTINLKLYYLYTHFNNNYYIKYTYN